MLGQFVIPMIGTPLVTGRPPQVIVNFTGTTLPSLKGRNGALQLPPVASAFKKFLVDEGMTLIEEITHFSTQPGTRSRSVAEGSARGGGCAAAGN